MKSLLLIKRGGHLVPQNQMSAEALESIPDEGVVRASITMPRSLRHHRLLFGLLHTVWEAQPEPRIFPTVESLLKALKIATGHASEVRDLQGFIHIVPDSIDFASMGRAEFNAWFSAAIDVILRHILPGVSKPDLERQIYQMLGEAGPDSVR